MVQENEIKTDNDDFMKEFESWSREVAEVLAKRNLITDGALSEDQWKVIEYVHEYYKKHGVGPIILKIGKATGLSSRKICELFPCGVVKGAYRLAGLPRPPGCI